MVHSDSRVVCTTLYVVTHLLPEELEDTLLNLQRFLKRFLVVIVAFGALTLLVGCQEEHAARKNLE